MNKINIIYRPETKEDYYQSEYVTQKAFWNLYVPGCSEHYLVHKLRDHPNYIKELTLLAVDEGKVVGLIMYTTSYIEGEKEKYPCITFGPLCVDPMYQKRGIGKELLKQSFEKARKMGFSRIVIFGEPHYYPKLGFRTCEEYGITIPDGQNFPAFMCYELVPNAFKGIKGKFYESKCYEDLPSEEVEKFNKLFPPLEKKVLPGQWGSQDDKETN